MLMRHLAFSMSDPLLEACRVHDTDSTARPGLAAPRVLSSPRQRVVYTLV